MQAHQNDIPILCGQYAGEDFYKHLVAVQEVMRSLGACTDLINAGLFHSIYGTQGFQAFTVPLTQRPEIQKIVGERAELLCYGMYSRF